MIFKKRMRVGVLKKHEYFIHPLKERRNVKRGKGKFTRCLVEEKWIIYKGTRDKHFSNFTLKKPPPPPQKKKKLMKFKQWDRRAYHFPSITLHQIASHSRHVAQFHFFKTEYSLKFIFNSVKTGSGVPDCVWARVHWHSGHEILHIKMSWYTRYTRGCGLNKAVCIHKLTPVLLLWLSGRALLLAAQNVVG